VSQSTRCERESENVKGGGEGGAGDLIYKVRERECKCMWGGSVGGGP